MLITVQGNRVVILLVCSESYCRATVPIVVPHTRMRCPQCGEWVHVPASDATTQAS